MEMFDLEVNLIPIGNVDKIGDGLRMAWEAGAAEEGLGLLELFRTGPIGPNYSPKGSLELVADQPYLWINTQGERFCDEGIAFSDSFEGSANARYREGYTYTLFNDGIIRHLMDRGIVRNVAVENMPGSKPLNFYKELELAIEINTPDVFAADSLSELAQKLNINPVVLNDTVEEYNEACKRGYDDLFAKNPQYLIPLLEPRYYAIKARTVFLGTLGGIKVNHRLEVLDKKDKVIPGLYAVGCDAGGMWGDSYPISVSTGAAAGFAINSGRLAGKSILEYIGKSNLQ